MDVASLSNLPVGVLGWNSPDPSLTIVVKATFRMLGEKLSRAAEQEPISLDRAHPSSETELYAASDFAPQKREVDVLVVGHARSRAPSTVLPFAVTVGGKRILLHAVAELPTTAIPLLERHVRKQPSDAASAVRLAPRRTALRGWLSRTVAPGFDFAAFNTAPPEHRIAELQADARLMLEGLSTTLLRRELKLPGFAAFAWQVSGRDAAEPEPVAMRSDTLWIDVDRELVTVTWRGVARRRAPAERPAIVVALDFASREPSWEDVAARLASAEWHTAVESHDLVPGSRTRFDEAAPSEREPTLTALTSMPSSLSRSDDDEATLTPAMATPDEPATVRGGTLSMDDPDVGRTVKMTAMAPSSFARPKSARSAPVSRRQHATDPMPDQPPESSSPPTVVAPLSLDVYVRVRAAMEANTDPRGTLAEEKVSLQAWEQAHRFWTERADADPAVDAELHARLWLARDKYS